MWLIVGLGNPGRKYQRNRHNIGFVVADALVDRHGLGPYRQKFGGEMASGMLSVAGRHHRAMVLKPMEFMNRSGFAVQRACQFHDIDDEHIIVIHDEIDLDLGRLKLKAGGGHGGHNGLRSIIAQLGSRDFLRVRAGVGKPGPPADVGDNGADPAPKPSAKERDRRVAGYVLADFPAAASADVDTLVRAASDATEAILDRGIVSAMNQFHNPETNSLLDNRA